MMTPDPHPHDDDVRHTDLHPSDAAWRERQERQAEESALQQEADREAEQEAWDEIGGRLDDYDAGLE